MQPDEQAIRELSYKIWEQRGRRDGSAQEDWFEARRQLLQQPAAKAAESKAVDESLKETFPASDPPASGLPDEPPVNADEKWAAAANRKSAGKRPPRRPAIPKDSA